MDKINIRKRRTLESGRRYTFTENVKRKFPWMKDVKYTMEQVKKAFERHYYANTEVDASKAKRTIHETDAFSRLTKKAMAHKLPTTQSDKTRVRITHVVPCGSITRIVAEELHLNADLAEAGAVSHDVGHTPYGHEGEKWARDFLMKCKAGTFAHNLQGALVLRYIENRDDIPWQVLAGIQEHNGETREIHVEVKYNNTEQDVKDNLARCLAIPGAERKQKASTFETGLIKLTDKISYAGQDLADGFREGFLDPRNMDLELVSILRRLGITTDRLNILLRQDEKATKAELKKIQNELMRLSSKDDEIGRIIDGLAILQNMKFNDNRNENGQYEYEERVTKSGKKFNEYLSRIANKLDELATLSNYSPEIKTLLYSKGKMTHALMAQDTTGGRLAAEIEDILIKDLIDNSKYTEGPTMSEEIGEAMYDLIDYNQENVVHMVCSGKQADILQRGFESLAKNYASVLLASGVIDEIYPQYKNEERNMNMKFGIWDNTDIVDIFHTNIVHRTREQRATETEYFSIVEQVVKMAEKNEERGANLTTREKIAARIAVDYISRSTDRDFVKKLAENDIVTEKELEILSKPNRTPGLIEEGSSMYETVVGRQHDAIERMEHKMQTLCSLLHKYEAGLLCRNIDNNGGIKMNLIQGKVENSIDELMNLKIKFEEEKNVFNNVTAHKLKKASVLKLRKIISDLQQEFDVVNGEMLESQITRDIVTTNHPEFQQIGKLANKRKSQKRKLAEEKAEAMITKGKILSQEKTNRNAEDGR